MFYPLTREDKNFPLSASDHDRNLRVAAGFVTVADLLASNDAGYSPGDFIRAGTGQWLYKTVSSGEHLTTAGGVKLKYVPEGCVDPLALGLEPGQTSTSQVEVMRTALTLATENDLEFIAPTEFVYMKTNDGTQRIWIKKVPYIRGLLKIKWHVNSGPNSTIMWVDGRGSETPTQTIGGTPTINRGQNTLTVGTGQPYQPGDWLAIEAGEDTIDSNERHWCVTTQVLDYTGSTLKISDPAPYDINYAAKDDVQIWRMDHNPCGGRLAMEVDLLGNTKAPAQDVLIRFCRDFTIDTYVSLYSTFGLAVANACQNVTFNNLSCINSTEQTAAYGQPRHPFGPWQCTNLTVNNFHVATDELASIAQMMQAEVRARDVHIKNARLVANWSGTPTANEPVFKSLGGSTFRVDNTYLRTNKITRLQTYNGTDDTQRVRFGNLTMDGAGTEFRIETVRGDILKLNDDQTPDYEFGPYERVEYIWQHPGGGAKTLFLDNWVVADTWIYSTALTSAASSLFRCVDDTSKSLAIPRTADSTWIQVTPLDLYVYWSAGGSVNSFNRLDLTAKELVINTSAATEFRFLIEGRRVPGDYF